MGDELDRAARIVLQREDDWAAAYWPAHRQRIADDIDLISRYPDRILDVGSAPYFTTLTLAMQGRDVVGVDVSPDGAPDEVEVVGCDIEREPLPFDSGSFDVLVFSEVSSICGSIPCSRCPSCGEFLHPVARCC